MEPLVSVIIPVYNVLPYLREALDSVINQTYKNLEILVVDDGSTDGSGEVCDEYLSDPRVIVIHQENKGLSGARNAALDRMTGDYVVFLDSDDAFMPEMVEKMLGALIRNRVKAAMCGYIACFSKRNLNTPGIRKIERLGYNQETILSSSIALNMIVTDQACWAVWNKMYQSIIWTNIRFPEGANFEDMHVMCQVIELCEQIVTVPKLYVLYRPRLGSITKTQSKKNLHDYLLAVNTVEKYILARCPDIISADSLHCFQEQYARILSTRYARLLFPLHPYSCGSFAQIQKDIIFRWNQLNGTRCQFHTRILHLLFLHAPIFIIPSKACWDIGKRLVRKRKS